jgi:hypothetical protein
MRLAFCGGIPQAESEKIIDRDYRSMQLDSTSLAPFVGNHLSAFGNKPKTTRGRAAVDLPESLAGCTADAYTAFDNESTQYRFPEIGLLRRFIVCEGRSQTVSVVRPGDAG